MELMDKATLVDINGWEAEVLGMSGPLGLDSITYDLVHSSPTWTEREIGKLAASDLGLAQKTEEIDKLTKVLKLQKHVARQYTMIYSVINGVDRLDTTL